MKLFVMIRDHVITFHSSHKQTTTILGVLNLDEVLLAATDEQNSRHLVFTCRKNTLKQLSLLCENESVYKEWEIAITSSLMNKKSVCLNCMYNAGKYSPVESSTAVKDNVTTSENSLSLTRKTLANLPSRRASLSDTSIVRTEVSVSEIRAIYDNPPSQSHTRRSSMSSFSSDTLHKIKADIASSNTDSLTMAKLNIDFSDLSAKYKELKSLYKTKCSDLVSLQNSSTETEQHLRLQVLTLKESIAKENFEKEAVISQYKSLNDQYQIQLAAQIDESDKLRTQLQSTEISIQQTRKRVFELEVEASSKQHPIQLTIPYEESTPFSEYTKEIERLKGLLDEQEKAFDKERASFKARSNSSIFKVAELEFQLKEKDRSASYIGDPSAGRDQPQVPSKRRGSSISLSDAAASDIKRCMDSIAQKDSDIVRLKNIVSESKSSMDDLQQQLVALNGQLQDVRIENETLKISLSEPPISQHRKVRSLDISSKAAEIRRSILLDDSNLERKESQSVTFREEIVKARYVDGPSDSIEKVRNSQGFTSSGKSSTMAMLFDAVNDSSIGSRRNSPVMIRTTFEDGNYSPIATHRQNDLFSPQDSKSSVDFNLPEVAPLNSLTQEQFDSSIIKRTRLTRVRASKYRSFIASSASGEFSSSSWAALESQSQPLRMLSQKYFSSTTEEDESYSAPAKKASSIRKSIIEDTKSSNSNSNSRSGLPPLLDYSHKFVPMQGDGESKTAPGEKVEKPQEPSNDGSGQRNRSVSIHRRSSEILLTPFDSSCCARCKSTTEQVGVNPSIPDKFNRRLVETFDPLTAVDTAGVGSGSSAHFHNRLSKKYLFFPLELCQRDYFYRGWEILGDGIRNRLLHVFPMIQLSYPTSASNYSPGQVHSNSPQNGRGLASPNKLNLQNPTSGNKCVDVTKGSVSEVLPSIEFYDTHKLLNLLLLTHISSNANSRTNTPSNSSPNVFSPNSTSNHQNFTSMRLIYSELMRILRLQNIQPVIAAAKSLLAIFSQRCEKREFFDCDDCGRLLEPDHPDLKEFFDSARFLISSIALKSLSSSSSPPNPYQ